MWLRTGTVLLLLALTLAAAAAPAAAGQRAATRDAALETGVVRAVNQLRARHRLAPLRRSPGLASAARGHSGAMARGGFFAHRSRDGSAFWRRVERAYSPRGYRLWAVGENLVWGTDLAAADVVDLWLASPAHRRNLLDRRWREIGVGALDVAAAPGVFGGYDVKIVTANFGVRR